MKRIFKNKFIACVIAAVTALFAAVFACLSINKNDSSVKAAAATPVTAYIYWSVNGNTLYLGPNTSAGTNKFSSDTEFSLNTDKPWYDKMDEIKTVTITNIIAPVATMHLFSYLENEAFTSIDLTKLDTSNVTNMKSMFMKCTSLTSLDVSKFDTSKVTTMNNMFSYTSVNSLDLSNFITTSVTNMSYMFNTCEKLTSVDLSSFDTSKVTNMLGMFYRCKALTSVDVSNFDTSNVTDMSYMFCQCTSLTSVDLINFEVTSNTNTLKMFQESTALKSVSLSESLAVRANEYLYSDFTTWYGENDDGSYSSYSSANLPEAGTYYSTQPNHSHDWSNATIVKAATCEEKGINTLNCDLCGKIYKASPATGVHDWSTLQSNSTHHWCNCNVCGLEDRAAHTAGDWIEDKAATCAEAGTKHKECTVCHIKLETGTIPATGEHDWGEWVEKTPATCTTDRKEEHTCSKCANKEEQTVAGTKLGHLYGDPVWEWSADYLSATAKFTCTRGCGDTRNLSATVTQSTQNATCLAAGKTTYTATLAVTGAEFPQSTYTDTQEVPITQLNHIAATTWSKDSGNHWHECTRDCGTKLDEAAHEYTIWKVDTAATVTSAGVGHHECVCGARGADEVIPMETCSHTNKSHVPAVEATCMAAGNPEYWHCNDCNKNLNSANTEISTIVTPVDPNNHSYTNYVSNNDADCTTDGTKTAHCDYGCGTDDTQTDVGSATGHNWADEWSKDETNHWHACSRCDEKDSDEEHTYDWVITLEPTEEAEGLKEQHCTVCGAVGDQEVIAKLVVDDNGNVSDLPVLPPNQDYDLEISVKESDAIYVFDDNGKSISKGFKVELFIVGEDGESTPFGEERTVTLMLHIPDGMEDFKLYKRVGNILEPVAAESYTVEGKTVKIKTTLPNEFVFNSPAPEEPAAGIPWWVWLLVGLVAVAIVGVVIIIIVVIKKKNDGGEGGVVAAAYDDAELKAKLSAQDRKLDEIKEIVDGGFNDVVDDE